MPKLSIVIPVYNEEESVDVLFKEIRGSLDPMGISWEIIFVDDCSDDRTPGKLKVFQKEMPEQIRVVTLLQRSGQSYALRKGLDIVEGDIVVTLDADLQNDPADIPRLMAKMLEGYDVVCGWRRDRQDKPLKKVLSKFGNILQRIFTGMTIHDISCTLRAYKKECSQKIPLDWEGQHRFIPLILAKQGYKIGEIVSHHRERRFGYSKYSHKRIFKVIYDFFRIMFRKF